MKHWSLAARIIASVVIVITACIIPLAISVGWFTRYEVTERLDNSLQEVAERLEFVAASIQKKPAMNQVAFLPGIDPRSLAYQIVDPAGAVLLRSQNAPESAYQWPVEEGFLDAKHFRVFVAHSSSTPYYIFVGEPHLHRYGALRRAAIISILPILLFLPCVWLLVRWSVHRALKPLIELQGEIGRRGDANLEPIPALDLPDEIAPIRAAVNLLLVRLKKALATERMFATNSAHELRNPIAGLLAQAQLLNEQLRTSEFAPRALSIFNQAKRISRLTEKLLQLSRATSGITLKSERFDLLSVLYVLVDEYSGTRPGNRQIRINESDIKHFYIQGDLDTAAILLRNLIENAVNHGDVNYPIDVTVSADGCIEVANESTPINPGLLTALTDPFVRGNASSEGGGLGLAIVSNIVSQMNGHMTINSPIPGTKSGFSIKICFHQVTIIKNDDVSNDFNETASNSVQ
ncbi:sensor histidine kinase [Beijerinckia mobilis]|uniref:sensor histidine kinase n=1 Tax=Beijerinckia mobilis TaxID=231434 RepID=UPI0009FBC53C|nr:HAMP domain-containing sensor histidine kinase [Beijerinckia mobilis]